MSSPAPVPTKIRFDTFELDPASGELRKSGILLKLQPQPSRVLLLLIERAGQVVTREELQRYLWTDSTFVDFDHGINFSINHIRRALADTAENPRYIETLPKRGYRFIGVVEQSAIAKQSAAPEDVPNSRYQSAPELAAELKTLNLHVQPEFRTAWWRLGVLAAILVVASVATLYWLTKRQPPNARSLKLRQLTFNSTERAAKSGAISRDGKFLAYTDRKGIHIQLVATGETRTVSPADSLKDTDVRWFIDDWSPDNTWLIADAGSYSSGSISSSLWRVALIGEAPRKLCDNCAGYSVSPDGSLIAFGTNNSKSWYFHEIWLMGPNGELPRKFAETDENHMLSGLNWSPDGQQVIYMRADLSGDHRSFLTRKLGGGPTKPFPPLEFGITPNDPIPYDLLWLHDGRLIALRKEPVPGAGPAGPDVCSYWAMYLDSLTAEPLEKPRRLFDGIEPCTFTSATKDGKQIVFLTRVFHLTVYVAHLERNGTRLGNLRHLTLSQADNIPVGWTPDSNGLFFRSSNRIYKQSLSEEMPAPIVSGDSYFGVTRVSPDGKWLVAVSYRDGNFETPELVRVPITGGSPERIFVPESQDFQLSCARSPSNLCVIAEATEDKKRVVIIAVDPVKGRGPELAHFDLNPTDLWVCDLSPDGTRVAFAQSEDPIHILSFRGQHTQIVRAKGLSNIESLTWAADGKALFVLNATRDETDLYHVDLQGNMKFLWKDENDTRDELGGSHPLTSPDGQHIAIGVSNMDSNLWLMENF